MSIIARFFPNGEFSQGVDTSKRRRDKKRRDEDSIDKNWRIRRDEYLQWLADCRAKGYETPVYALGCEFHSRSGYTYVLRESSDTSCTLEFEDYTGQKHSCRLLQSIHRIAAQWGLVPLVHQMVESCEKPKSRKKLDAMTKNMARNIRNAVYLLERKPGGKDVLSFLTLTLPNLSPDGLDKCCQSWDAMVKQFFDWLRKYLEKYNMPLEHVYCTEIQLKRLEKRHEYAPHLHVVFRGRYGKKTPWLVTPSKIRKAWRRCISSVVSEPFDSRSLENLQRVKYSAARYLSKYLSKSTRTASQSSDQEYQSRLRTQWGGMARTLSRLVRQHTSRLSSDGASREVLIYILSNMELLVEKGFIRYFRRGFIQLSADNTTGHEYGLHVLAGCLATPALEGGLTRLYEFCQLQLISE